MNGTATYNCHFKNVFVPDEYVVCRQADELVRAIRPSFILSQTGMALGLIAAVVQNIQRIANKQCGANTYLQVQPPQILERLEHIRHHAYVLAESPDSSSDYLRAVMQTRLDAAYLALDAANAGMLHTGGARYVRSSAASRRLREAYFVALVTPTVKHLEKVLQEPEACQL